MTIRKFAIALLAATCMVSAASAQIAIPPTLTGVPAVDNAAICNYVGGSPGFGTISNQSELFADKITGQFPVFSANGKTAVGMAIVQQSAAFATRLDISVWLFGQQPLTFSVTALPYDNSSGYLPVTWQGTGVTVQNVQSRSQCTNVSDQSIVSNSDWLKLVGFSILNSQKDFLIPSANNSSAKRDFYGLQMSFGDGSTILAIRPTGQYVPQVATFAPTAPYIPAKPVGDPPGAFGIKLGQPGASKPDYR